MATFEELRELRGTVGLIISIVNQLQTVVLQLDGRLYEQQMATPEMQEEPNENRTTES